MNSRSNKSNTSSNNNNHNNSKSNDNNAQGPPIAKGRSKLSGQYSMPNYDFSMHESMSGDSTPSEYKDDENEEAEEEYDDEGEREEEKSKVIQIVQQQQQQQQQQQTTEPYINMADHSYHSMQGNANANDAANENDIKAYATSPSGAPTPPYGNNAEEEQQKQGTIIRPLAQRKRGVDLSSSSEEYEAPETPEHMKKELKQKEKEQMLQQKQQNYEIKETFVDDSQYDELEEKEEQLKHDKYQNQFMRIPIPASELKEVDRVEKDIHHDKPKLGRRQSFIKGLQRAVSGVKLNDNNHHLSGERTRPTSQNQQQTELPRTTGMLRTSSQRGGLHRNNNSNSNNNNVTNDNNDNNESNESNDYNNNQNNNNNNNNNLLERNRDESNGGANGIIPRKRQTIGNLGRMISRNRQKNSTNSNNQQQQSSPTSRNSISQASISQESLEQSRNPSSQTSYPSNGDRPRTTASGRFGPGSSSGMGGAGVAGGGRKSISQMGRILSRGRRKSTIQLDSQNPNVSRDSNAAAPSKAGGTRASLSKIGRVLSLNRGKSAMLPQQQQQQHSQQQVDGKEISPMSTSTVSTASMNTSPIADRDRGDRDRSTGMNSSNSGAQRRESRLSLRGAGKMFSLSRRSTTGTSDREKDVPGLQKNTTTGNRNSRQLMSMSSMGRSRSNNNMKRNGGGNLSSNSTAASNNGGNSNTTGSNKVDGRADKFVFSEVTSQVIAESGLIGNGKHIRVAQIAMAEYSNPISRDKWYIDLFTLSHNAIRRECIDLYDMLSSLARCYNNESSKDINEEDINLLEKWWEVTNIFFKCYFNMERRILFPWIDSAGSQEWEVQLALKKMRSLKDKLETLLNKVDKVWNEKTFKSIGEIYSMIYKAVDDFIPRLMNYFADQEVLLPAIVKEYFKREHALEIDKQIVNGFMNNSDEQALNQNSRHCLVSLVRWIPKSKQLRAWLGKYLTSAERSMYPTWYQLYDEHHTFIVTQLKSRAASP